MRSLEDGWARLQSRFAHPLRGRDFGSEARVALDVGGLGGVGGAARGVAARGAGGRFLAKGVAPRLPTTGQTVRQGLVSTFKYGAPVAAVGLGGQAIGRGLSGIAGGLRDLTAAPGEGAAKATRDLGEAGGEAAANVGIGTGLGLEGLLGGAASGLGGGVATAASGLGEGVKSLALPVLLIIGALFLYKKVK